MRQHASITRQDLASSIFRVASPSEIAIKAGVTIVTDGREHHFNTDVPVAIEKLVPGSDYGIRLDAEGNHVAELVGSNPLDENFIGGFHYAPGGNAEARDGGSTTPAINPHSLWDVGFRPICADPRGMALISGEEAKPFWADIYLLGVDHDLNGTSRHGIEIADGRSLDLLDFATAKQIIEGHGKRMLTYDEFKLAAFGVTEKSSATRDPRKTGLDAARTSRFGLMQATGNLWIWGTDGDPEDPRPSIFGGSWLSGAYAGSRCAGLDYWPENSSGFLGARGASDHLPPV